MVMNFGLHYIAMYICNAAIEGNTRFDISKHLQLVNN
jgi:hypothetical protein